MKVLQETSTGTFQMDFYRVLHRDFYRVLHRDFNGVCEGLSHGPFQETFEDPSQGPRGTSEGSPPGPSQERFRRL